MARKTNATKAAKAKPAAAAVKAQPTARKAKAAAKPAVAALNPNPTPARAKAAATPRPAPAAPVAAVAAAAAKATNQINERTNDMQNEATQKVAQNTQALFGDINERAKTAVERSARALEEMTDLTRGNVEALVASSTAFNLPLPGIRAPLGGILPSDFLSIH